jgi:hypothetical protein
MTPALQELITSLELLLIQTRRNVSLTVTLLNLTRPKRPL